MPRQTKVLPKLKFVKNTKERYDHSLDVPSHFHGIQTLEELADAFQAESERILEMVADGVTLDAPIELGSRLASVSTGSLRVAKRYKFETGIMRVQLLKQRRLG